MQLASSHSQRPYVGVSAYQTIRSFLAHLLEYQAGWNPAPVAELPGLAQWLGGLVGSFLVLTTAGLIWHSGRGREAGWKLSGSNFQLAVALTLTVAPLLAPAAEEYHFTLLILPLLVVTGLGLAARPLGRGFWLGWVLAVVLLAPAWPYRSWPSQG